LLMLKVAIFIAKVPPACGADHGAPISFADAGSADAPPVSRLHPLALLVADTGVAEIGDVGDVAVWISVSVRPVESEPGVKSAEMMEMAAARRRRGGRNGTRHTKGNKGDHGIA
jgi:hypothetical protein